MSIYEKPAPAIQTRYTIRGTLRLTSPTTLSNGDSGLTDIVVRRDQLSGRPLLPGTSLAGALRAYLQQRLQDKNLVSRLFGYQERQKSVQSWLFVDDALGHEAAIEIRDGVAINSQTRIAAKGQKYDQELLAAGSTFDIALEFWQPVGDPHNLLGALTVALQGLEEGEIALGVRKRRGFGRCQVTEWRVQRCDMRQPAGIKAWLTASGSEQPPGPLRDQLGAPAQPLLQAQDDCRLTAKFEIVDSLIIRAAPGMQADDNMGPDAIHLRDASGAPVLPGTSVAGALRAQAERILHDLHPQDPNIAEKFLDYLFGPQMNKPGVQPRGSRIWVRESKITDFKALQQHRVKIDRFTGGSSETALFSNEPLFSGRVKLDITIEKPSPAEAGLLLLLLKDLWTGFLPLGGESSVGRGRLRGLKAKFVWNGKTWRIAPAAGDPERRQLAITLEGQATPQAQTSLQEAVTALKEAPLAELNKEESS